MKKASTVLLKFSLLFVSALVILLAALVLPNLFTGWSNEYPSLDYLRLSIVFGLGFTLIPFFVAIWQAFHLLRNIDQNKAFTQHSVNALAKIKYSAFSISAVYVVGLFAVYNVAQIEDAPGLIVMWATIAGLPFTIGVFANLVQRLLQNVIDIKQENDLTV